VRIGLVDNEGSEEGRYSKCRRLWFVSVCNWMRVKANVPKPCQRMRVRERESGTEQSSD
jgi:hypothetical protein